MFEPAELIWIFSVLGLGFMLLVVLLFLALIRGAAQVEVND